jgi:hypothetical protein
MRPGKSSKHDVPTGGDERTAWRPAARPDGEQDQCPDQQRADEEGPAVGTVRGELDRELPGHAGGHHEPLTATVEDLGPELGASKSRHPTVVGVVRHHEHPLDSRGQVGTTHSGALHVDRNSGRRDGPR